MKGHLFLLLLPAAVFAQSVGDTVQQVEQTLGKPRSQRTTDNGQICIYGNGAKVKYENGVVREVSVSSAAAAGPAAPSAASGPAARPAVAAEDGTFHQATLDRCRDALVKAGGVKADAQPLMQKRYLFIYFSAHWCPPCRAFTPRLVEFYNANFANGDFDLLFVSDDPDQNAMNTYMSETGMPWTGIKLGNPMNALLSQKFGVTGIPCLVLLDENDQVLASSFNGRKYLGPQAALEKYAALHKN